jgi:tRNA A37 threonylcarbamoyladenosine dehydratase
MIIVFSTTSLCQETQNNLDIKSAVWLGVDFTAAKFTLVPEDPAVIVNQYLNSINTLVITEQDKFNIKKFFKIPEVTNDIEMANQFNAKIDPSNLVISDVYKFEIDKVKEVIKKYDLKDKMGTGLIFVAENLNKTSKSASYYVCFFDLKTKKILECKRKSASVTGIGFRNYWASSIYAIMKDWAK